MTKLSKCLDPINPSCWSSYAFGTNCKSNMISNNIVESFNSWIKHARDKPLLTILELIRRQLMNRFSKREGANKPPIRFVPRCKKEKKTREVKRSTMILHMLMAR
jgi:hypothetical protein